MHFVEFNSRLGSKKLLLNITSIDMVRPGRGEDEDRAEVFLQGEDDPIIVGHTYEEVKQAILGGSNGEQ